MKKIKTERRNSETGEEEVVALTTSVPSPAQGGRDEETSERCDLSDYSSDRKVFSPKQELTASREVESSDQLQSQGSPLQTNLQQQQQQQQQPQQQQPQQQQQPLPNIQRSLPPGAPANYCNICNKELCNKYFMKTHMQKMHGINLDDYPREAANSGGVVCDICQKELCSKYFLKVHKSNTHGITDFTSGSASSQAANAATAVAAIALTNYSLNNAQKRAALNLALNQHQLQNRQAAALMNAAAASAAFNPLQMAQAAKAAALQRGDQLNASSIIGHLQQQQSHQQQQPHPQQQQQAQLLRQQQPQLQSSPNNLVSSPNIHAHFPAALLATTANNPLLAAQLAQHHHFHPMTGQPPIQPHQTAPLFFPPNEEAVDTEDDASDRDSLADQSSDQNQLHKSRLAMSNFHQQLQNQQALLNAAAVFNPAAAAAAMLAMQQQQQQQQQQHLQHQEQRLSSSSNRQQTAMDLRNQSISQMIAQQVINARQQDHQLVTNCTPNINNSNAQLHAAQLYNRDDANQSLPSYHQQTHEEDDEEEEDDFDSDRDSLIDEGIFRQTNAANASEVNNSSTVHSPAIEGGGNLGAKTSANFNNNGSLLGSSINTENENDGLINCTNDLEKNSLINLTQTGEKSAQQQFRSAAPILTAKQQLNRPSTNPMVSATNSLPSPINNLLATNSSPTATNLGTPRTPNIPTNSGSNSNNNNNSRYLRHYTEACPICDRRFKSIKWLQSHVMNDHKNEIGNLFNLLVQVLLCSNTNSNGSSPSSNSTRLNEEVAGAMTGNVGSMNATAVAGLPGIRAGMVGLDLQQVSARQPQQQQQQQQQQNTTSTANRGNV